MPKISAYVLTAVVLALVGCGKQAVGRVDPNIGDREIRVVTTTGMVTDIVENVGGERVAVEGLMGPGVDPHLYKATEGDVIRLADADVVFYNGLHLEAKLAEVFERMGGRVRTVAVTDGIPRERLIASAAFGAAYDPHVWFDVRLWMDSARETRDALIAFDPAQRSTGRTRSGTWPASPSSTATSAAARRRFRASAARSSRPTTRSTTSAGPTASRCVASKGSAR
jgi:manganese/zinc/iron transport system substrate-binding protein